MPKTHRGIKGESRSATSTLGRPVNINILHLGEGVEWFSLEDFARIMEMYRSDNTPNLKGAGDLLRALGVPLVDWCNGKTYFMFSAFEKACFFISRYGGPGFIAPATRWAKRLGRRKVDKYGRVRRVTPAVLSRYGAGLEEDLALTKLQKRRATQQAVIKQARKVGRKFIEQVEREAKNGG